MIDSEDDIRGLLTRATAPAPKVDLADVVAKWRRRRRTRRRRAGTATAISLVLLVAVTSLVVLRASKPPAQVEPPTCVPSVLPQAPGYPEGPYYEVMDPSGRYVAGEVSDGKHPDVPAVWTDGVPTVLSFPPGPAHIFGINSHGVAVGTVEDDQHETAKLFRYEDGVVTMLASPVPDSWAYTFLYAKINDAGVIVMTAQEPTRLPQRVNADHSVVVEWAPGAISGHIVNLPGYHVVEGITSDRLVTSRLVKGGRTVAIDVTDLDGVFQFSLSTPDGSVPRIDDIADDWAVGGYAPPDRPKQPVSFRWNLRTGHRDELPYYASAVNSKGWVLYLKSKDSSDPLNGPYQLIIDKFGAAVVLPFLAGTKRDSADHLADGAALGAATVVGRTAPDGLPIGVTVVWRNC